MQRLLFIKVSLIAILCLLFLVGLAMVDGLVDERQSYQYEVIEEIKQMQIGNQIITTPFLVSGDGDKFVPLLPSQSHIEGQLTISDDKYSRNIYQVIGYTGKFQVTQSYNAIWPQDIKTDTGKQIDKTDNTKQPNYYLFVPISDLRGVHLPFVMVNGRQVAVSLDTQFSSHFSGSYLQASLGQINPNEALKIQFEVAILGLDELAFVPLGANDTMSLSGDWADVKFHGAALPNQKQMTTHGFGATWQNSYLGQSNADVLAKQFLCQNCNQDGDYQRFRASFIKVNNIYTQTDRAIKYALILLLVSFGTFFLFEMIKHLRIHVIQYALVAAALLSFYTLLLSLAEHIAFWQAYTIASLACVGLIGWYACYMLKSFGRGMLFALILGGLYGGFYVILSANEFNLLLGSVFCFVLIFVVMFITRHFDWYAIGEKKPSEY